MMKSVPLILVLPALMLYFIPLTATALTQSTEAIQAEINSASLGEIVFIPAGAYKGSLILKNGVALVGSGDGETIIDGSGADIVIEGADDAILSNLTVTGGRVGLETRGGFMGVFDCAFRDNDGMAIHVGGGSALIVNNVIEGGSISCNSSNPLIICNTIVTADTDGLWSWYGPGPTAINNLVVGARHGVQAGAGSVPSLDNNAFWANEANFAGCAPGTNSIFADPLFMDAEGGDFRLDAASPLIGAGKAIDGLWGGERPDVGWNEGRTFTVEECRALMDLVAADLVPETPVVVYTLGETAGEFLVTTKHPVNRFTVCSSTADTPITDIDAFDEEDEDTLTAELVEEEYPRVDVRSEDALPSPTEAIENRYILRNTYHSPASYYEEDGGALRIFRRKTNFPEVLIEAPDGYRAVSAKKNGLPLEEDLTDVIEISSPGIKEIEVIMERAEAD